MCVDGRFSKIRSHLVIASGIESLNCYAIIPEIALYPCDCLLITFVRQLVVVVSMTIGAALL